MQKSFKTEINPTMEQKTRINKTIGTCRYVYNFCLAHNKALYEAGEEFMTGRSFSVWLNSAYFSPKIPYVLVHRATVFLGLTHPVPHVKTSPRNGM